jgi:hypothetical protein
VTIAGTEGFTMPCTQHDALVWLSGSAYASSAVMMFFGTGALQICRWTKNTATWAR